MTKPEGILAGVPARISRELSLQNEQEKAVGRSLSVFFKELDPCFKAGLAEIDSIATLLAQGTVTQTPVVPLSLSNQPAGRLAYVSLRINDNNAPELSFQRDSFTVEIAAHNAENMTHRLGHNGIGPVDEMLASLLQKFRGMFPPE